VAGPRPRLDRPTLGDTKPDTAELPAEPFCGQRFSPRRLSAGRAGSPPEPTARDGAGLPRPGDSTPLTTSISQRAQQPEPLSLCYSPSARVQLWDVASGSVRYTQNPTATRGVKAGGSCPRTGDFSARPAVPGLGYPIAVRHGRPSSPGKLEQGLRNADSMQRHLQALQNRSVRCASSRLSTQGGQRDLQGQGSAPSTVPATAQGTVLLQQQRSTQNHSMVGVGRDLCGSPSPTPC